MARIATTEWWPERITAYFIVISFLWQFSIGLSVHKRGAGLRSLWTDLVWKISPITQSWKDLHNIKVKQVLRGSVTVTPNCLDVLGHYITCSFRMASFHKRLGRYRLYFFIVWHELCDIHCNRLASTFSLLQNYSNFMPPIMQRKIRLVQLSMLLNMFSLHECSLIFQ